VLKNTPIGSRLKMKAELRYYNKEVFKSGLIQEIKIWEVQKSNDYPEGLKYSLIILDSLTGDKILMDNHRPKKHHYHLNDKEFEYFFKDIDQLFKDFENLAFRHLGVKL
jgi:hypothetical protein